MRITLTPTKTRYHGKGLNWNQYTEDVFDAVDALRAAVGRCQAEQHYPDGDPL